MSGGGTAPASRCASGTQLPTPKEVEGTVKRVDPGERTVQISSGILGIFGTTVEVTDETEIMVQGRKGSLADVQEGAKVKASYEARQGENVAKSSRSCRPSRRKRRPARLLRLARRGVPPGRPPVSPRPSRPSTSLARGRGCPGRARALLPTSPPDPAAGTPRSRARPYFCFRLPVPRVPWRDHAIIECPSATLFPRPNGVPDS